MPDRTQTLPSLRFDSSQSICSASCVRQVSSVQSDKEASTCDIVDRAAEVPERVRVERTEELPKSSVSNFVACELRKAHLLQHVEIGTALKAEDGISDHDCRVRELAERQAISPMAQYRTVASARTFHKDCQSLILPLPPESVLSRRGVFFTSLMCDRIASTGASACNRA